MRASMEHCSRWGMVETFKDAMKNLLGNVPEKLKRKKKTYTFPRNFDVGKRLWRRRSGSRLPSSAICMDGTIFLKILLFGKHRDCGDRAIFNAYTSAACRVCAHRRVEGWADAATAAIYFRDHFINMNEK